jgi:WD40 repeat protein/serine/threonine protein kinase
MLCARGTGHAQDGHDKEKLMVPVLITQPTKTTLRERFSEVSSRSLQERVAFLTKVSRQVAALHRSNQIHGGINPETIQINNEAPLLEAPGQEAKKVLGYSAPELLRGERQAYTIKTDIFSLGVLFYELLSTRKPFEGESDMQVLLATLEGKPKPHSQWITDCPAMLNELCLKMLSPNKENRPVSVEDIARTLDELLQTLQAPKEETDSADKPRSAISIIHEIARETSADETQAPIGYEPTLATPAALSKEKSAQSNPSAGSGQGSGSNRAHIFQPRSSPSDTLAHGNVGFQPTIPQQAVSPSQRYKVVGELARGGLGKILRATDQHMGRPVAIKEMLQRLPGEFEARFLREAKITARLEHPAIIPVHDLGKWSDGSLYYTMKLVNGRSFDKIIAENKTLEERIALLPHVIAAADAIAYAHSQKIIHRDLKPHNVLIGPFGETVVIDWGIAKDLSDPTDNESTAAPYRESPEHGELTREGAIVGTPAYMPIEQAQGKRVDARADVYALGAILYHLLSGKSPYSGKRSVSILRDLLESPPKPLQERVPDVPRELLTIVEKAMAREAESRYPSAQELADDLKKYQTGQLVGSYQYSTWEIIARTIKKYQLPIAVGSMAMIVLLMSAVWYTMSISEKNTLINRKNKEALETNANLQTANTILEKNNLEEKERKEALYLDLAEAMLNTDPAESLSWLKKLDPNYTQTPWGVVSLLAADAIQRGIPEVYGAAWATPNALHTSQINHAALSSNEREIAVAHVDGRVYAWDLEAKTRRELTGCSDQEREIRKVAFSPDGASVASASGDGSVRVCDAKTGKGSTLIKHNGAANDVAFSPNGELLASAGDDGAAKLWSVKENKEIFTLQGSPSKLWCASFSPDSSKLATAHTNGEVSIWDTTSGKKTRAEKYQADLETTVELAFSMDGEWLLFTGQETFSAHLLGVDSGIKQSLGSFSAGVQSAKFSHDGKRIAIADQATGAISLFSQGSSSRWDVAPFVVLPGNGTRVWSLAFSMDDAFIAAAGADATIKVWELSRGKMMKHLLGHKDSVKQVMFKTPGELISISDDQTIRRWDARPTKAYTGLAELSMSTTFSPDGQHVAAGGFDNTIRIWSTTQEKEQTLRGHSMGVFRLAYSPDGASLASASVDGSLRLWDIKRGTEETLFQGEQVLAAVAYSPDGKNIAAAGFSNKIIVVDPTTKKTREFMGHTDAILALDFSPDAQTLASISYDYTVRLWDVESGKELKQIKLPGQGTFVDFAPNGLSLVVTLYDSNLAQIIDLQTNQKRSFSAHTDEVYQTKFSSDGQMLLSAGLDGTVRLWDIETGKSRPIYQEGNKAYSAAISPDNQTIVVSGTDGKLRVWSGEFPKNPETIMQRLSQYASPLVGSGAL